MNHQKLCSNIPQTFRTISKQATVITQASLSAKSYRYLGTIYNVSLINYYQTKLDPSVLDQTV